jgi:hypothetical protein
MQDIAGAEVLPPDPSTLPYNNVGFPGPLAIIGGAIAGALGASLLFGLFARATHAALRMNDFDRTLDDFAVAEAVEYRRGQLSQDRLTQVTRG